MVHEATDACRGRGERPRRRAASSDVSAVEQRDAQPTRTAASGEAARPEERAEGESSTQGETQPGGGRGARDGKRRGARTREGEEQGEDGAAEGSMRGESGTHESKRRRIGESGQREWETALNETGGTRAQGTHGRGEATQGQTAEVPSTAAMRSMRGIGSGSSTMGESSDTWRGEQKAAEEEHGEGGREDGQREAAATPQREEEEERMQTGMEQQPTAADSVEARHSRQV